MPMDLMGSFRLNPKTNELEILYGAVKPTLNVVVADETNRLSPKTASALLRVMENRVIDIQGTSVTCADPFLVIGTQNPIEQEGVYPLPEALKDRFCMQSSIRRLSRDLEIELTRRPSIYARKQSEAAGVVPVLTPQRMIEMRDHSKALPIEMAVSGYMVDLVRATDPNCDEFAFMPSEFRDLIESGAGLRGSKWLTACSRANAALRGSLQVHVQDAQAVAAFVLQHRITLKPDAKFSGRKGLEEEIVLALLETVPTVGLGVTASGAPTYGSETAAVPAEEASKRPWWRLF
jgi:MoxR-like ATPase